ncbi:YbaY family lipoprotein, partial [Obesumbacterium proteus]
FNPQDIQPNQRINLSAAIKIDGRLVFITDTLNEVVNNNAGTQKDLVLVPVSADGAATVLNEKKKVEGTSPF